MSNKKSIAALIEEGRALHEKTTQGEWKVSPTGPLDCLKPTRETCLELESEEDVFWLAQFLKTANGEANLAFITWAHNAFPSLAAAVKERDAEIERLKEKLEYVGGLANQHAEDLHSEIQKSHSLRSQLSSAQALAQTLETEKQTLTASHQRINRFYEEWLDIAILVGLDNESDDESLGKVKAEVEKLFARTRMLEGERDEARAFANRFVKALMEHYPLECECDPTNPEFMVRVVVDAFQTRLAVAEGRAKAAEIQLATLRPKLADCEDALQKAWAEASLARNEGLEMAAKAVQAFIGSPTYRAELEKGGMASLTARRLINSETEAIAAAIRALKEEQGK